MRWIAAARQRTAGRARHTEWDNGEMAPSAVPALVLGLRARPAARRLSASAQPTTASRAVSHAHSAERGDSPPAPASRDAAALTAAHGGGSSNGATRSNAAPRAQTCLATNSDFFSLFCQPMQLVELKNGETYNGELVACDNWMNIRCTHVHTSRKLPRQRSAHRRLRPTLPHV